MSKNKKIALFIDCENVSHKHMEIIMEELASYGEVNIRKAYGDWKNSTLSGWNKKLFDYSLEPIHQPPYSKNKNATDIKMTVEIMKVMCQSKNMIDYIALVTSDSDFTPLVTEIKAQGIEVLGFGEEKTSNVLQKACSEFIELGIKNEKNNLSENFELVKNLKIAIKNKQGDNDYALIAEIGTYLKNKHSINAKKYGDFKTWGDIFKKLNKIFEISHLEHNGKKSTMIVKIIK